MINQKHKKLKFPIFLCTALVLGLSLVQVLVFSANAQGAYDFGKLQREKLGRGVVALREDSSTVVVSWRYLSSDPDDQSFDVYRDGKKVNKSPLKRETFFKDNNKSNKKATYTVKPTKGAASASYTLPANAPHGYINIPLKRPAPGVDPLGKEYSYVPNDASIGDVDGDGEYEIFLKWEPTNTHDNGHSGYSGPTFIECLKLDGTSLWRIDMGINIRSGAHYTQFMVYDFDGDGCAELVVRTADGTRDGLGKVIGDKRADYRNTKGRIITGPDYLTVFNGKTGAAMCTVDYIPQRGNTKDWGDDYGNRSERFLAAIAYLDGVHPSVVMCRGYYQKTVLAAFNWDGKKLKKQWVFDSTQPGNEPYAGQGNHNLRIADVDGDGCDEIIYGQMAVDNNGKGLYSTGMRHGDAMHLLSDVDNSRYYIWGCHENKKDGTSFRDAGTGKVIFKFPSNKDIGRCMAADIDPTHKGIEMWSPSSEGLRSFTGELIASLKKGADKKAKISTNMAVWWDGDLLRELLDRNVISKYNWKLGKCEPIFTMKGATSNNWTKANPCLQGDIIGDWREEVLMRAEDNENLRLYITTIPTDYRFHTFLEDPVYRISIATQNVAYNQPTNAGFYFGPDLKKGQKFRGTIIE